MISYTWRDCDHTRSSSFLANTDNARSSPMSLITIKITKDIMIGVSNVGNRGEGGGEVGGGPSLINTRVNMSKIVVQCI